ncbi:polysaccharide biosynthesis protein [Hyphomonas sp. WL0036]|uniref:UDP-N-acetylglucosamine 4,6-dehydratase family protein n=1 Tax=Hyphomonas sediminis TaxID=2866160 RepID=UPI001C80CBF7|nr:nucleoside-diphosphate sugar epimerase/dehydratase [Hyphomonas sediminis]MBY9067013.1 polysaccharide biosynthesis protein [Hyphomonas sediminis]
MAGVAMTMAHIDTYFGLDRPAQIDVQGWLLSTIAFMISASAALLLGGIHRQVWRHIGAPDAWRLVQIIGLTALFYLPSMVLLNDTLAAPVPTLLLAIGFWTVALFGGRMIARWRSTQRPMQIFQRLPKDGQPILLLGDQESWIDVLRRLETPGSPQAVRVLGLVEMDAQQPGRAVRGAPILGSLTELNDILEIMVLRYGETPWVALTGPARAPEIMLQVLEVTARHGAEIMALGHDATAQILEAIHPADLLARPERQLNMQPVQHILTGARVLVTGGGGSIGSELVRQVAELQPACLTIIDFSEFNLYQIELELRRRWPHLNATCILGDIRDEARMADIFSAAKPDIVIHAAALKHVPLMERHACEAILTNVAGAYIVAQAAKTAGAKRFVFISTDKAVDPDNVMGATKRLAELCISRIMADSGMAGAMVRFGNVLGSSGSVVPLFERQIAEGGPVTITDPDATRFFMTIEEASALVLQAAALQRAEDEAGLFVLDMGEPIPIRHLAETMIRLKGKVPYVDIAIEIMGLREGEKLHEELTYPHEALRSTPVSGVHQVSCPPINSELFGKQILQLIEAARHHQPAEALRLLGVLVPEYGSERAELLYRHLA